MKNISRFCDTNQSETPVVKMILEQTWKERTQNTS